MESDASSRDPPNVGGPTVVQTRQTLKDWISSAGTDDENRQRRHEALTYSPVFPDYQRTIESAHASSRDPPNVDGPTVVQTAQH